ncbi:hypothetical protein IT575_12170 [bacterium]|nr:hypothetical protein [bacterium]
MSVLCTIADLQQKLDTDKLVALACDDTNTTQLLNDSDVQARLSYYISDGSNKVRRRIAGKFPDLDSDAAADSTLAADLRDAVVSYVLMMLYNRRGHYGTSNPFSDAWREAKEELDSIAVGKVKAGAENRPDNEATSSTASTEPAYARSSDGTASRLMEKW